MLESLGIFCSSRFNDDDESIIEKFICNIYVPSTIIQDTGKLRWWLFTKRDIEGSGLPPTRAALTPFIKRVNSQVLVWKSDGQSHPNLPSPIDCGWEEETKDDKKIVLVMRTLHCAPETVLRMIRCGCAISKCSYTCKCRSQLLRFTELCLCGGDKGQCETMT